MLQTRPCLKTDGLKLAWGLKEQQSKTQQEEENRDHSKE